MRIRCTSLSPILRESRIISILVALAPIFYTELAATPLQENNQPLSENLSTETLETQLRSAENELKTLPLLSLRSGVGAPGFSPPPTNPSPSPNHWIQFDLKEESIIDSIVVVPTLWRTSSSTLTANAFPKTFTITAGTKDNSETQTVITFDEETPITPKATPLVIPIEPTKANWLRFDLTSFTIHHWTQTTDSLQLSEILLFDGEKNVCLDAKITSSFQPSQDSKRSKGQLNDGILPYLMDSASDDGTPSYVSAPSIGDAPELTIDLEDDYLVETITIHSIDFTDSIPQSLESNFGLPQHMIVEGSSKADFSDAVQLAEFKVKSIYEAGPILTKNCKTTLCRFIRFRITAPYLRAEHLPHPSLSQVGFGEIQIIAGGVNQAKGKLFEANFDPERPRRIINLLTDGKNRNGKILPMRQWLEQLSMRSKLEKDVKALKKELQRRYSSQQKRMRTMAALIALLVFGIILTLVCGRFIQVRNALNIRRQLASDLHDEIGANLHTIGLLSDIARNKKTEPEELEKYLRDIRQETERSGRAVRRTSRSLEGHLAPSEFVAELHRSSHRILREIPHQINISNEASLSEYSEQFLYHLFLFYRECLVNTIRHSDATEVTTTIESDSKQLRFEFVDNGNGLPENSNLQVPNSLIKRASRMRAQVKSSQTAPTGLTITLLKKRRSSRFLI